MSNCTIGAKIISPGNEFLLFKNKDFGRQNFNDQLVIRDGVFAIAGTESWSDKSANSDVFSGFSIAVNSSGLACCDSNVRMKPGAINYDILTKKIAEECSTIDDAVDVVEKAVHAQRCSWGNIVVATKNEVAAFQVTNHLKVFRHSTQTVRANHHIREGRRPIVYDGAVGTVKRYEVARRLLGKIENIHGVFSLLRSHEYGINSSSICSHGRLNTVYGYVVHIKNNEVSFHVCRGNPCTGNFTALYLDFDDEEALQMVAQAYPSRRRPQIQIEKNKEDRSDKERLEFAG